ncbi:MULTISPECIES: rhodanese-like domain-containing protein [Pontibacillus]|uniref:Rhodanese-like domain-containing protein n=1 Tax=Pontibacillus chungwhensis TaxID=265426 RepID=A0ABY8UUE2_9BACI|nr:MULTISPECIES: rhodanese-like domain-containing protein [Pontibacillus]MCD5325033.1 rhodanese-like domain-containing protein [Pontibacillus sp. HN14]WIF97290.1 rhodanese-like domain-containing protein [Pontibacillus chungwhensis]
METLGLTALFILLAFFITKQFISPLLYMKKIDQHSISDDYCVIDVRDYVSAHRSPYPKAENIPLSYLPRALKEQFECSKEIVLVSDDLRGVRMAAKMIRKKKQQSVYYIQPM